MATKYIDPITGAPGIEILGQRYSLELMQDICTTFGNNILEDLLLEEQNLMEMLV